MVATEYGSIMILFWRWLGCPNGDDRDGAENKRTVLLLAGGTVTFPWPLPPCRVLMVLNAHVIFFWTEVVAGVSSWL